MVLISNPQGLLICIAPMIVASIASVYLPRGHADIWILVGMWGVVITVWDVLLRLFNRDEHWLHPDRGGHIFFVPVFVIGALVVWWYIRHAQVEGYWLPRMTPDPNRFFP